MNIIIMGRKHGQSRTLHLGGRTLVCSALLALVLAVGFAWLGYAFGNLHREDTSLASFDRAVVDSWQSRLDRQRKELDRLQLQSQEQIDALTIRMADLQARLMRLDALGQRLTEVAKLENGEFDFSTSPALGGPIEPGLGESFTPVELQDGLTTLARQIQDREQQLKLIDQLFVSRNLESELFIAGRPIDWGWMSSSYGYRSDPFTGKRAWHAGVDFAGKEGSNIIAVASGVVTWAGERYGYGLMVEVNHGGGYATRYAHCKELLVNVGAVVNKGHAVGKMGSTGRSTGPHVHYEVLKEGKTMDPKNFIHRAAL